MLTDLLNLVGMPVPPDQETSSAEAAQEDFGQGEVVGKSPPASARPGPAGGSAGGEEAGGHSEEARAGKGEEEPSLALQTPSFSGGRGGGEAAEAQQAAAEAARRPSTASGVHTPEQVHNPHPTPQPTHLIPLPFFLLLTS